MLPIDQSGLGRFVCAVVLAGAMTLAGCSKGSKDAGRALREKVDVAQRLVGNSLALANSVTLKAPVGKDDANAIELLPAAVVDPQALAKLKEARELLTAAITENAGADQPDKSFALAQLGKVERMIGYYYAQAAQVDIAPVAPGLARAAEMASRLHAQGTMLAYNSTLMNATDEQAVKLQADAQKQAQEKSAALAALDKDIKAQEDAINTLGPKQAALLKEAASLRVDSKGATGKKALELAEQAMDRQAQANKIAVEIADAEAARDAKKAQRGALTAEADLAAALEKIAKEATAANDTRVGDCKKMREALEAAVADGVQKLEALGGQIVAALKQASANEKLALDAYEAAFRTFEGAYTGAVPADQADVAVGKAEAAMAQARLWGVRLHMADQAAALSEQIKQVWPKLQRPNNEVPAVLAGLPAEVIADAVKPKEEQTKLYTAAADGYLRAMGKVREPLRWAYQGQAAAAYLELYRATKSPDALERAKEQLKDALTGRENSPYLAQVVELQRQVEKLSKTE